MSGSSSPYVPRKQTEASYRPKGYGISPGLQRARAQYRIRNAVTGIIVGSFAVGVWAYSIGAVKQDSFEDVDEEAKTLMGARTRSVEDEEEARKAAAQRLISVPAPLAVTGGPLTHPPTKDTISAKTSLHSPQEAGLRMGVIATVIDKHFPRFLDPSRKTFVWGAPPVDHVGRVGESDKEVMQ